MKNYFPNDDKTLREGMLCVESVDGYRASFSLSEIINRADQNDPLLMYGNNSKKKDTGLEEKGRESFSIYAGCDMFADRAIKGLSCITLF